MTNGGLPLGRPSAWRNFLSDAWPWLVGFIPGFLLLFLLLPVRVPLPWHDGWAYVQQYENWLQGAYDWRHLFAPTFGHPSAVFKIIYFAVLHWTHADFRVFPLLSWIQSVAILICVGLLSRPLWSGNRRAGTLLMLASGLCIFTTALGHSWIWDIVFQNFIPGLALAISLVVLASSMKWVWRLCIVIPLSVLPTFTYGSGFLVGPLLSLALWQALTVQSVKRRCLLVVVWLACHAITMWIAFKALEIPHNPFPTEIAFAPPDLADRPWMRLQFTLILLGQIWGKGTVVNPELLCAIVGGVLVLIFVLSAAVVFIQGRKNPVLFTRSVPWITFCFFGLTNAFLICVMRMHQTLVYALLPRYGIFTLFFVVGTLMLAYVVCKYADASGIVVRLFRRCVGVTLGIFLVTQLCSWAYGWQFLKVQRLRMEQERALLSFAPVIPLDADRLWNERNNNATYEVAKFMAGRGLLKSVTFATDNRIASFKHASAVNPGFASFDSAARIENGPWKFTGVCRLSRDLSSIPDLVLITAQVEAGEEKIVALAPPVTPDDFFDGQANRRGFPEHYFAWSGIAAASAVPSGPVTFRAYAYLQDSLRVRPIEGIQKAEVPGR